MTNPVLLRTRIILTKDNPYGLEYPENFIDVEKSYNLTSKDYYDRLPDIEVRTADGTRMIITKEFIAGVHEKPLEERTVKFNKDEQPAEG